MVATLVRLRMTMLGHALKQEAWRVVVLVLGALWALSMTPSVLAGMAWLGRQDASTAHDVIVLGGSLVVIGWAVIPVLLPGMDDTLDISRFATFGLRARTLVPGLLVAGLVSVPVLFTGFVTLAPAVAWGSRALRITQEQGVAAWSAGVPVVVAVIGAPVALLTCLLASRLTTTLAGRILAARRSRRIATALTVVVGVALVPVLLRIGQEGLEGSLERVPGVAAVLGWTPVGVVWAAPAVAAQGDLLGAVGRLAVGAGWVVLCVAAWGALLQRALESPPARGGQVRRRPDAVLGKGREGSHGRLAAGAVTRRALRYWSADPRYVSAMLGAVAAPLIIVLLLATVVDVPDAVALSVGVAIGGSIGWGRHNDLAFDGSAFWLHVVARAPGWSDRTGRAVGALAWSLPVTVAVTLIGVGAVGRWDLAPAAVGAGVGVLCTGLAVSAVSSVLLPYPVPQAGASPFAAQMGAVGASLAAQLLTSATTLLLCLPVLVSFGAALWWRTSMAWVTLGAGVLGGAVVLVAGIVVGGRLYDARAARLLVRLV
ncbi:hypothetical protein [Actinotalea sp. K2]|uniref:hypothetical protein n=1 Tax=Actinotalea sp. K2 TaxID=2939438 RepID=UPI00201750C8|nr:hypothetical protein [Actinotalea sp. K2]MCL3860389.1 hypothetical protein [Actinotalea sp. K2]